jgi:prolyl-tRNA synthetase
MRWSKLFIPTLREDPAETGALSHKLLLRAGYLRRLPGGLNSYLFLGWRSLDKIAGIIRKEMDAIGAQEFLLPAPHPGGAPEEVAATTAGGELRSYKQLPQIWYQLQRSFGEEPGPHPGPARVRQAFTHNAYSFDLDAAGSAFEGLSEACGRILARCGLEVLAVEAFSGARYLARSQDGDDLVVTCPGCDSAARPETAVSLPSLPTAPDPEADLSPEEFHTPAIKTIAALAAFANQPETSLMKTLVMVADGRPCLVLLRGDHQLSEAKLAAASGAAEIRPAYPDELRQWLGADAGSLGPVGVTSIPVLADSALVGRRNMISGANRDDYHLRNVTAGEDFTAEFHDLRQVAEGDACSRCGATLRLTRAVELAYANRVGPGYAASAGVRVTAADRRETAPAMGSYGIEIEQVLSSAAEAYADSDGMCLPPSIAPFQVVITPVSFGEAVQREGALEIYRACRAAGLDTLLDDRDERPGVKFKDADLVGIPYRITVGRKLADGVVELGERRSRQKSDTAAGSVVARLAERVFST